MFAGPNGSGKSTLIYEIGLQFNLGYLINADTIESDLNTKRYIDCSSLFPRKLTQNEFACTFWINYNRKNLSFLLDLKIIFLTIKKVLVREDYFFNNISQYGKI